MAEGGYFCVPCSCFSGIHVHVSVFLRAFDSLNDYLPERLGKCRMQGMRGGEQASGYGGRRSREGWISGTCVAGCRGHNPSQYLPGSGADTGPDERPPMDVRLASKWKFF